MYFSCYSDDDGVNFDIASDMLNRYAHLLGADASISRKTIAHGEMEALISEVNDKSETIPSI